MRAAITTIIVLLCVTFATAAPASAQMGMEPYKGSAEFEQLKQLIGVWEGEMPMKDKGGEGAKHEGMPEMMTMRVEYRLTAGGSAIQETFNAGSPMEMVSMYHDRGGNLSMTHYCMLGNQPRMDLDGSGPGKMSFTFAEENMLDPATGMHMHSMNLSIVDADNITQRWTMFQEGEAMQAHDMHLTRIQ